jgi:hypothetical protein
MRKGPTLGFFNVGFGLEAIAFDGANIWVATPFGFCRCTEMPGRISWPLLCVVHKEVLENEKVRPDRCDFPLQNEMRANPS